VFRLCPKFDRVSALRRYFSRHGIARDVRMKSSFEYLAGLAHGELKPIGKWSGDHALPSDQYVGTCVQRKISSHVSVTSSERQQNVSNV
jgi:hypothetical protein